MTTSGKRIKIHSVYFSVAVASSTILPLFVFLYALFNQALTVFTPFVFIIPIVSAIAWVAHSIRNVEIDKDNKLIIIRDGFASIAEIPFGSITAVTKEGAWYVIAYKQNEEPLKFRFAPAYYYPKNLKKILTYISELNPQAQVML